jgi:hypothetical protein
VSLTDSLARDLFPSCWSAKYVGVTHTYSLERKTSMFTVGWHKSYTLLNSTRVLTPRKFEVAYLVATRYIQGQCCERVVWGLNTKDAAVPLKTHRTRVV